MQDKFRYLPPNERKKILLITDDIRFPSGVGSMGKEIILHTAHHFNWVNLGGAVNHPENGKRFDLSPETNKLMGIEDSYVHIMANTGYGTADQIRAILKGEKFDAIFLITDPRYFIWLFQIENEIRQKMPIIYLNIWDDYPTPFYNKAFYESCDALLAISKQTKLINELVLGDKVKDKISRYVPHGINTKVFYPIEKESKDLVDFKKKLFGNKEYDFVLFFNSRNIRRKSTPDTLLAFRLFLDKLPKEKADRCAFLLHTELVSEAGTDLIAVKELLFGDVYDNVYFSHDKIDHETLNKMYNIADSVILLSSAEGWGLSLTEALVTGTPIIANTTGGMQDQMRFEGPKKEWFEPTPELPSNNRGTLKQHGEWAFPVYPTSRSIVGSPLTPYIWDDRCTPEDAADRIMELYEMSPEERQKRGEAGRKWATNVEAGFTAEIMGERVIEACDTLFNTWAPREKYEVIKIEKVKPNYINHSLVY
jgi:glycosyltransferase involved in cell wall biosynthesis